MMSSVATTKTLSILIELIQLLGFHDYDPSLMDECKPRQDSDLIVNMNPVETWYSYFGMHFSL